MGSATNTADIVAKRRDILAVLETKTTKPELVDAVSASRSTVDRAIESLCEESLVESDGSHYVTTYAGRQALAAYQQYLDRLDALTQAQPVLSALAPDIDIDPAVLDGSTVVESTPSAPQAPVETNISALRGATAFRGTGPAVIPLYTDVVLSLVEDDGTDVELVLTDAVVDALADAYPDEFASLNGVDGLALYVTGDDLSYAVWTAESPEDTVTGIVVYGDNGIVGVINNDTDAMNEWATSQYEQARRGARRLD
jgi:predicted transcriptional regulator